LSNTGSDSARAISRTSGFSMPPIGSSMRASACAPTPKSTYDWSFERSSPRAMRGAPSARSMRA